MNWTQKAAEIPKPMRCRKRPPYFISHVKERDITEMPTVTQLPQDHMLEKQNKGQQGTGDDRDMAHGEKTCFKRSSNASRGRRVERQAIWDKRSSPSYGTNENRHLATNLSDRLCGVRPTETKREALNAKSFAYQISYGYCTHTTLSFN